MRIFAKIQKALEIGGPRHLLVLALKKLISPIVRFGGVRFYVCELNEEAPAPEGCISLRQAAASDMDSLWSCYEAARTIAEFQERFQRKNLCFLAIAHDRRIANSRWCVLEGTQEIPELNMQIVLGPGEAYVYDVYTRSDFRGRGFDSAARDLARHALAARGVKKYYLYVRADSPLALRAVSAREKVVGVAWYVQFAGFKPVVFGIEKLQEPTLAPLSQCDEGLGGLKRNDATAADEPCKLMSAP